MKIKNSIILITGGASGLGENMARYFDENGAIVYICDLDEKKGHRIAEETNIRFIKCDVTNEENVKKMIETIVKEQGRIDALVNSAGIFHQELTATENGSHSMKDFERIWRVNTYGTLCVTKHAAKVMIDNADKNNECNGVIIFISSLAAIEGRSGTIAYSGSKASLIGMTLPMARDLGKYKIRVNTMAPVFIETPMISDLKSTEIGKKIIESIPLKTTGKPKHVTELAEFLIKCDFMNGEVVRIDGGCRLPHF